MHLCASVALSSSAAQNASAEVVLASPKLYLDEGHTRYCHFDFALSSSAPSF